ncbi:MAG TPA: helix-turn-helix transcriptional regulator [Gemmatimonadales bacterium]|nr:helix-turn-helix transcriptional regulator [Gemmatimonadales bacterium]
MSPLHFRIRELRESKGWSQAQLALQADTRQATISDIETGRARRVEIALLERLAIALDVEPGDLIYRSPKRRR